MMEIIGSHWKVAADEPVPTLSLYRSAPELQVRLNDFESFAIDRLSVLRGILDALSRDRRLEEMETLVSELWKANMGHPVASQNINKDIISHFVLRLVYCKTEDLWKWFLSMVTTLFRHRFRRQGSDAQKSLMREFNLSYKALGHAEYETVREKLSQVARSISQPSTPDAIFFKVPFEEVAELVAGRKVYLHGGYAYVAMNQKMGTTIQGQEKDRL